MRLYAIVCAVLVGMRVASAQPPAPAAPVPSPPAPAVPPQLDRALAEQQCEERDPACDWVATLGGLERASVLRALAARGYVVEPSPWGKVIGQIHIYNEDVFAEGTRLLKFLNLFHITTRERTIRSDLVVQPGEVWDPERIAETARRLRDPLFSSVIAIVPVTSKRPGTVDVLVVTRDIWSLRLNTTYTFQQGTLTNLALSLSENNFLGLRTVVAAAFTMDQGSIQAGPLFIDKNFLGQHLDLRGRINTIVNRSALFDDGRLDNEGSSSDLRLSKVLWKLSSQWGWGATFSHRFAIDRRFVGLDLREVRCPLGQECETRFDPAATPEDERLPWIYRMRRWSVGAYAVRQFGTAIKQQLTFGHTVESQRPRLLDSFPGINAQREPFARAVLPRSELTSVPYVGYSMFTPWFRTRRNVGTYDLAEDLRLGPDFETSLGVGLQALGSDANFLRGNLAGGWTLPLGRDGSARLGAGVSGRYQGGTFIDNTASVTTRIVTPVRLRARIVAESTLATRWNDTMRQFFAIGSDNGLRGFDINEFFGQRLFGTQIEVRSLPMALWVLRMGGVLFYDLGGAADTLRELELHQDAGFGLRVLLPQTSRELFRFDLAFPLDGDDAGHPRFIAGFQSEF